ncbi:iron ABC transporter permease [Salicibibacter halophilus]|uniref:Iron ABC transporter permease n=1 Tax=Salicibibacter halophilus TaxID=2502791 RepID=A0A514LLD0_9BACI|nr:iron ABC transporter permease [Salicibibacter halophilus]QDI92335.1 iron ABC transporter permease [Salicibibacter halophilus]
MIVQTNTTVGDSISHRFKLTWKRFWSEPGFAVAAIIVAALLILFILLPLAAVLLRSFGIGGEGFSFQYYQQFLQHSSYFQALLNSIGVGVVTTAIVISISIPFALYVTRTKSTLSKMYRALSLLPMVAPPFIFSLSLIILLGRRGVVTEHINNLFGVEFSIYGFWGVVVAQVLGFFPIAYMMIESSLRSINPSLEHASRDLGAGQARTIFKVSLPLASTGILKASLIVFVMALADFSNPLIIGGETSFLASDAYLLVTGQQNLEMAAVLGVFLIIPSLIVFLYQTYFIKDIETTSIDSSAGTSNVPLNKKIQGVTFGISTLMALFIAVMFIMVVLGAFVQIIGVNNTFTLDHFSDPSGWEFISTSLIVSFFAALLASVLGLLQGYLTVRKNIPAKKFLEFVALFGLAVPGTVMGIGYVLIFNGPPLFLTGTVLLLVLNMTFRKIGVGLESGISKLHQIDTSMEEASADLGAKPLHTLRKIVLPLLSPAFMSGFVYTFMTAMVSVSSVIFLVSPGTNLAATYILNLANQAAVGRASAMSVIMIAIVLICMAVLKWIERRNNAGI